ncbi:SusC/RagA family TonB-linked outer membrane protein [Mucilaginibacter ginsenosidivorax]|uniref:SusC/RagA family TonB-linked outer membrane protein n=1 Tax=Mucilaginibacter ginsenosidivorax TaxID=862126 RepID=A0A5B8W761_9SPHI|nr:SusC/RagA family TonB-linked outer membrane protein [Mucilaginibacter ginsenosidivorax]QEC79850.1 SusC/RagA family TonB-linked outer membrane protein [Mucilaginibacter ginsenosidivorax]
MEKNLLKVSRWLLIIITSVFMCGNLYAQNVTIRGVVLDENNQPFPGVGVQIKGTAVGTLTSGEGRFTIGAAKGQVLTFKFLGYAPQEVTIGTDLNLSIQLKTDSKALSEVVVTAYGVKKEVKRLGYAVQEVKGSELIKARDPNPINSLAGKVAGLSIGANAEMLGRPEIVLRGSKDLLFVVDGSPINSDTWNISADDIETYTVLKGPNAAALYGSRGINGAIIITTKKGSKDKKGWQVDFNSSTVLDGSWIAVPKAQTEYGRGNAYHYEYQAKDGSGSALYTPQADVLYDNGNRLGEYGPRFEGQLLRQFDSPYDAATGKRTATPWVARGKNNYDNFAQQGYTNTSNIAFAASGTNYSTRFSYSHLYQKGIFPNTALNSDNFNLSASYNINSKLTVDGNINFNKQYSPNVPDVTYGPNSYIYMFKVYGSADYDVRDLEDIYKGPTGVPDLVQYAQEYGRLNNPWFVAKKWLRGHDKTDIYAYLKLNYAISKDFNASLRSQISTWTQRKTEQVPSSANLNSYTGIIADYAFGWYGDYREDNRQLFENNTDFALNYNHKFGKWNVGGLLGANSRTFTYNSFYGTTRGLALPNVYVLSNSSLPALEYTWDSKMQVYSGYYSLDFGYDKYFNVNTTGRVDNLSTLPKSKNTFFYPSVSLSTVVSDYIKLPDFISFLKLRASVADVKGALTQSTITSALNQVTGYSTNTFLGYSTDVYTAYDGPSYANQNTAAYASYYNNTASVAYSNTLANAALKPFNRLSWEYGADLRLFQNRLNFDATYFDTQNGPQIYPYTLAPSTGYSAVNVNAITTKRTGFEIAANLGIFRKPGGFNWDLGVNYSTFKETLSSVLDNDKSVTTLALGNHVYKIGDRLDEVYGTKYLRDGSGNVVYKADGTLLTASGTNAQTTGSLGYLNPDYTFGIINRFSYKSFGLSFQFDGRIGGKIYDYNYYAARQGGTDLSTVSGVVGAARLAEWQSTKTGTQAPTPALVGNELGNGVVITSGTPVFVNGVISNPDQLTFSANSKPILVQTYLNGTIKSIDEAWMISRSFAKLREVTLSYTLPQNALKNTFIKSLTFSLVGRNLLYFAARKDFDIDQYASGFNSSDRTTQNNSGLQSSTTRKYGFNLNLSF